VRAFDPADQGTLIDRSTDLTLVLRERVLASGTGTSQFGFAVAAAGDVDNDGFDDVLVGGRGRAELIFGAMNPATAKRVVFLGTGTGVGRSVAGLGDFNGDGFDDFAIGDPIWTGFQGRVSVFFGRPQAQWPTGDLNIENSCEADLCLDGSVMGSIARALAGLGNFDGAVPARPDLAIGSPFYPALAPDGQLLVVLGADYTGGRTCTPATQATDCRASEACTGTGNTTCAPTGTFWKMRFELPSGNWLDTPNGTPVARLRGFRLDSGGVLLGLGTAIASLSTFDTTAGTDLAVSSPHAGQVHYLSGRAHSGLVQFDTLDADDLGLRDPLGDPDTMPIATGSATDLFGAIMATPGDIYTPSGSTSQAIELAVGESLTAEFFVLPGEGTAAMDPGFSAPAINVASIVSTSFGASRHPSFGLLGDLDFDGRGELLGGTFTKEVFFWHADRFLAAVTSNTVARETGSFFLLASSASDSAELNVQYVGDFNGDGHPDVCVGDNRANTNQGQAVLLY
jgi:hypothetical protein